MVGVDDWAWRRGKTYGTILVDLEKRRPIDLLPDRSAQTLADWLSKHSSIEILTRDRSTEYARGMSLGAPWAMQVADRWHLIRNLIDMLERTIHQLIRQMGTNLPDNSTAEELPLRTAYIRTPNDRAASEAYHRKRKQLFDIINKLYGEGMSKSRIAALLSINRQTVIKYVNDEVLAPRKRKLTPSILDPYLEYLDKRRREGCENASQLWREIREQGYPGTPRQVLRWMQVRRSKPSPNSPVTKPYHPISEERPLLKPTSIAKPDPSKLTSWMITDPELLSDADRNLLNEACRETAIAETYMLARGFLSMIRTKKDESFAEWLDACVSSQVKSFGRFAKHLLRDKEAVQAAITSPWSNGQVEGQIHRLKLIKRQMYGRASFELLKKRVLYRDKIAP